MEIKVDKEFFNNHRFSGHEPKYDKEGLHRMIYIDDTLYELINVKTYLNKDDKVDYIIIEVDKID